MAQITYGDKRNFIDDTAIPNEEKVLAEDLNEIKRVVNENFVSGGGIAADTLPVGTIAPSHIKNPENGWLLCNGSLVKRKDYPELYAVIGTMYGDGDGTTTFALPNGPDLVAHSVDSKGVSHLEPLASGTCMIIKAKQLFPIVGSVSNDTTSTSKTDALSADATHKAINDALQLSSQYIDDHTTIIQLTEPPTSFKVPSGAYTKAKYTVKKSIGAGNANLVYLTNNQAFVQIKGVYRITVDVLWLDELQSTNGSVQIRIGSMIKQSTLISSTSGSKIYSACGIVEINKGEEIPLEIYQSTGSDVTIKALNVKVELLSRLA